MTSPEADLPARYPSGHQADNANASFLTGKAVGLRGIRQPSWGKQKGSAGWKRRGAALLLFSCELCVNYRLQQDRCHNDAVQLSGLGLETLFHHIISP